MHNILYLTFFIIIMFLGCSSSKNDVVKDEVEQGHFRPIETEPVSPETAQVEALIIEYSEKDENYHCRIRIRKVVAYGPATPPLAVGSELSVEIAQDLLNTLNSTLDKMMLDDHTFALTIRMKRRGFGGEDSKELIWRAIKIN